MFRTAPWVLFLLIGSAALPVYLVYIWFRLSRLPAPPAWFLCSVFGGFIAAAVALVLGIAADRFLPADMPLLAALFRSALTEELGRLLTLLPLLAFFRRLGWNNPSGEKTAGFTASGFFGADGYCAATGLVSGAGFALIEGIYYGVSGSGLLLRAFSAAPLHGACGAGAGLAAGCLYRHTLRGLRYFFSMAAIHTLYNFLIRLPGVTPVLGIAAAFCFLILSLSFISRRLKDRDV
jgi:RsiW-degrading membrane proteinase PrsW (M82 family)